MKTLVKVLGLGGVAVYVAGMVVTFVSAWLSAAGL